MGNPGKCGDDQHPFCVDQYLYAPSGTCCEEGRTCLLVAANSTVVCCPRDNNCERIESIPCDVSLMAFPGEIQSTVRQGNLTTCDDQCCPWGYFCETKGICGLSPNQDRAPPGPYEPSSQSQSTSSYTSSPTSSYETPNFTTSAGPSLKSNQTTSQPGAAVSSSQSACIAVGSFFGVALAVLAIFFVLRRRKSKKSRDDTHQDNNDEEYPVGTSVHDQGGRNALKSQEQPANPDVNQGRLSGSKVYELSG
ncbi:hypothetical protein F5Y05DRAFT_33109 [Hypoxylon sp. FL0543]|nr:hypothetical protein F5Y05DRAFT_33109 [Hypoxylon sp. FL0543]